MYEEMLLKYQMLQIVFSDFSKFLLGPSNIFVLRLVQESEQSSYRFVFAKTFYKRHIFFEYITHYLIYLGSWIFIVFVS